MRRRQLLAVGGVAITSSLAGCGGNGDDDEEPEPEPEPNDSTDNPDPDPDEEETASADEEDEEEDEPERSDADTLLSIRETLEDDEPLFSASARTFDGEGESVTDTFETGAALTAVTFEHEGESNFALELDGDQEELLVNTSGVIDGATAVPQAGGEYLIDVTADGEWSVTLGQPIAPAAEIRTPPVSASGNGPDLVGPVEITYDVTVTGEHEGESNFAVLGYDEYESQSPGGQLIFNDTGEFEGETRADQIGIVWFDVEADGAWRLSIE